MCILLEKKLFKTFFIGDATSYLKKTNYLVIYLNIKKVLKNLLIMSLID